PGGKTPAPPERPGPRRKRRARGPRCTPAGARPRDHRHVTDGIDAHARRERRARSSARRREKACGGAERGTASEHRAHRPPGRAARPGAGRPRARGREIGPARAGAARSFQAAENPSRWSAARRALQATLVVMASVDVLEMFHPVVARWFADRFGEPTAPQRDGWPAIAGGQDTLIAAPTGSGKTLAAFLACIDDLLRRALVGRLPDATQVVYVSPPKALPSDVRRDLAARLRELREAAAREGLARPEIRVAVRTGDTPVSERGKMARRPPQILVTAPESLYILLTSERGRAGLGQTRTVIVDEAHAVAGDKRGAHLALSLERLERLVVQAGGARPVRVGLSATQKPIELVGRMLTGAGRTPPVIVDSGWSRTLDLKVEITDDELGPIASGDLVGRVYDRIAELVLEHHTTLVFVNTRRLVERV